MLSNKEIKAMVNILEEDYLSIQKIGEGGFGCCFKASRKVDGKEVCLKVLKEVGGFVDEKKKKNFEDEFNLAYNFINQNIMEIYDIFQAEGLLYMESELCDGTLWEILSEGEYTLDEIKSFIIDAATGLKLLKDNYIVHFDIKPDNILVKDGIAKLCDFGLAIEVMADDLFTKSSERGTYLYRSPESIKGAAASFSTDVWSLGVLIYYIFLGHHPFYGKDKTSMKKAFKKGLKFPDEAKNYPYLIDILEKALEFKQEKRITIEELLDHPFFLRGEAQDSASDDEENEPVHKKIKLNKEASVEESSEIEPDKPDKLIPLSALATKQAISQSPAL